MLQRLCCRLAARARDQDPATSGKAEASLLGLTTRKDGTKQVTYNGLPLYYVPDTKAGQVTGNQLKDQFGFWARLQPSGKMSASG